MKKLLKYSLWSAGGVVAIAIAGVAYIAATFNPNDYKTQIIKLVKDKQQRSLKLDGDIKLVFFPSIGADIGKISLSEFQSDETFIYIDSARVSLALLPLLSRQVVVDEVSVSGLKATLVKFKNGKTNIDDLLSKKETSEEKTPLEFDIASVRVGDSELTYLDESKGAQYTLKSFNLNTGRIANGVPGKIDFSAVIQSNKPKLDISAQMKVKFTFDLKKQLFQMEGLELQAKGTALDISNLTVLANGNISANFDTQEFSTKKLVVTATGLQGKNNFDAKLDAPALNLVQNNFTGDKLTLNAKLDNAFGNIVASLALFDLTGNPQSFKSSALTLELDMKQPEQAFKIKLGSPVTGNIEQQQLNLSNLTLAVNARGDKLPNKSVSSEMKGSVQIDGGRQSIQTNLAGGLLQSQVKAKVAVNGFQDPAIRFDIDVDQFDADLYLPKEAAGVANKPTPVEQSFDLAALKKLNLEGGLRIGALKIANVKLSQVRLDIKAQNGLITISPLSTNLYQGSMNGSLKVNAQTTPHIAINQNLSGINITPLLKDAVNFDTLEGKGSVALNLTAQGNTISALKKTLNGSMSLNLTDGAIKGINIAKTLRDAQSMLNMKGATAQTQSVNKAEKTDFSELKASFKISNGVAHNDDLLLKSPLLRLSGNGDINIGNDTINYLTNATLAKTLKGQGGKDIVGGITVPVRLSGPFNNLKYTLDFGAMASNVVKQKIEAKKEEIKTKLQDQLQDKLKGLFK
ncbi:AsmA family protein [Candidatus Nitrotoga arctica]|uniref:Cell envelope biogenesis protein AsmA n=1 Tax=Candidatus Nitrotoga arctica TaxID=453162 RepID=A0ABM8Z2D2_9PROT|nr:AsmA family protein [Candidatus Nitrotoga arctica]CAG9934067.1 Cell envelope biogenesis protein AsmA [Candidatus Nitrotoga arctica]